MDYDYSVEYSQTWSGGLQYQLRPTTMARGLVHGHVDARRRQRDGPQRARAGPGPIQARRPIPQLSRINAIRFDGKSIYHGVTFKVERRLADNFAYNVSYTLSHSKDDASSPGATESEANVPQNVRNIFDETGEWALSSFDHRHQFIASGVYQLPFFMGAGGVTRGRARRLARQRHLHRAGGRAVHRESQRRPRQHRRRSGAASRSAPRPQSSGRRADARALVRHRRRSRCRRRSRSAARRATA